jgi:ubiquinone/menaquinone biosynthesis C-methylase UbiE
MNSVKEFYDQLQFPGTYTIAGLDYHSPKIRNPYLKTIGHHLRDGISVLDAGCGTGLISNLFARKYPGSHFAGIDFADSVNYATQFAFYNNIKHVL